MQKQFLFVLILNKPLPLGHHPPEHPGLLISDLFMLLPSPARFRRLLPAAFLGLGLLLTGCNDDDAPVKPDYTATKQEIVKTYGEVVYATYSDVLTTAQTLDQQAQAFVAAPTAAGLEAVQQAWLAARVPYGQSEAFRFYGGPIDDENGPEGLLNAWPMDEAYVDYVDGNAGAGIINNPAPTLPSAKPPWKASTSWAARPTSPAATTPSSFCSGARISARPRPASVLIPTT